MPGPGGGVGGLGSRGRGERIGNFWTPQTWPTPAPPGCNWWVRHTRDWGGDRGFLEGKLEKGITFVMEIKKISD